VRWGRRMLLASAFPLALSLPYAFSPRLPASAKSSVKLVGPEGGQVMTPDRMARVVVQPASSAAPLLREGFVTREAGRRGWAYHGAQGVLWGFGDDNSPRPSSPRGGFYLQRCERGRYGAARGPGRNPRTGEPCSSLVRNDPRFRGDRRTSAAQRPASSRTRLAGA